MTNRLLTLAAVVLKVWNEAQMKQPILTLKEYCSYDKSLAQILKDLLILWQGGHKKKTHLTTCKHMTEPISMRDLLSINLLISKEIWLKQTMKKC